MDSAVLEYQSVLFDDNLHLHADDLHLDLVCFCILAALVLVCAL